MAVSMRRKETHFLFSEYKMIPFLCLWTSKPVAGLDDCLSSNSNLERVISHLSCDLSAVAHRNTSKA